MYHAYKSMCTFREGLHLLKMLRDGVKTQFSEDYVLCMYSTLNSRCKPASLGCLDIFLKPFSKDIKRGGQVAQWLKLSCSCRRPRFGSQHPHGSLQPCVSAVPEDLVFSSGLRKAAGTHTVHIHTCGQSAYIK